ncbi:hypothetical protein GE061_010270 [Apolygus lucorum]|uniref:Uncharacterized protein n=1 Tax=Apolygus lucorum TaxID=248454 RepID=A0A6A4JRA1_APOLU|nr:hypothetical protein GE061_010270 [Apolygus lucorum]
MGKPFIPENTLQSYQHAYKLGAKWVDMDLSITSDGVVVIYHDFTVKNIPVWNMTFNQFKSKVKFPTVFEAVLNEADQHINFAVEIKYPSIDEIKSENLGSAPNLKDFVKKVIDIVKNKKGGNREVTFNSFEPDALVYIKKIAPHFNIFFDTEGLPNKFTDPRRNSLEEAIQFCLENDLQGIVTDTETITSNALQHTMTVHSQGLGLMLYFYRSFSKKTDYVEEITKFDCVGIDAIVVEDIPMALKILKNITSCTYNDNYTE